MVLNLNQMQTFTCIFLHQWIQWKILNLLCIILYTVINLNILMNYKLNFYDDSLYFIFDNIKIVFIKQVHILVKNNEFIFIEFILFLKQLCIIKYNRLWIVNIWF